ncbi:hypothetical protein BDB00DRAFT_626034 [Zychaea mexicana]|uniref:uncharacterized protein n=1 Tax=Zychaea mexicana TaxID=64656 RepID=UPI0022FE9A7B|nr:uncharacterized protein BDB00DRAFT_626034 [Zychaea mexicana]KAI9497487.1 hypothetical protein BDB00DRAFT_626034 [Zychaea mexicana]
MDVDTPLIKLDVLELVNGSRMTYGLRHQDFQRYRKHCTHRVQRLRQILHLTKPNNKKTNQQKELPAKISDARYLHLYVFEVERAWAYAMDLNQELSADTRKRHHTRKKLKRATQHAEALYELCEQQDVEDRSKLEAYAAAMRGHLYFELQQWQDALNQFVSARTIYEHFAGLSSTTHHEALCYAAIDDIDPSIRICAYNLRLNETSMASNVDELVKSLKQSDAAGIASLEQQLSKISQDGGKGRGAESLAQVSWRDRQAAIKNDKVAKAVAKAQEATRQSDSTKHDDDASTSFDRVLAVWAEAEKLVKKALKEDKEATAKVASSKSAKSTEELQFIYSYVAYNMYARSIQRNVQLVAQGDSDGAQRKPQENVRLHDDILKYLESIRELLSHEQEGQLDWELNVLTHYYRGCRCLHVAQAYADLNRIAEAVALYRVAQTYIAQAKQLLHQGDSFASDSVLTVSDKDLVELEQTLRNNAWKTQAAWYLKHGGNTAESDLQTQMEQLNLDDEKKVSNDTF